MCSRESLGSDSNDLEATQKQVNNLEAEYFYLVATRGLQDPVDYAIGKIMLLPSCRSEIGCTCFFDRLFSFSSVADLGIKVGLHFDQCFHDHEVITGKVFFIQKCSRSVGELSLKSLVDFSCNSSMYFLS